jgi:hypothetical protein
MPDLSEVDDSFLVDKTQYHCRRHLSESVITMDDGEVATTILKEGPYTGVRRMDEQAYSM